MKIAFPLMGNLQLGLESCLEHLGINYIKQKPVNKKVIELGVKNSPESACLPFKVNLGNFIEALDAGADTLLFAGGFGPCRFGYYGMAQAKILQQLGYKFDYLIIEMVQKNQKDFFKKLSILSNKKNMLQVFQAVYLGYYKIKIMDEASKLAYYYRPREEIRGTTEQIVNHIYTTIKKENNLLKLKQIYRSLPKFFKSITKKQNYEAIPVALIGEIYTLLEPGINFYIEKIIGALGLHIHKSLYLSDWIKYNIFLDALGYNHQKHFSKEVNKYLKYEIGGHTRENLSKTINMVKQKGCRGIIHLAPLTCMPEIVTKEILSEITKDLSIPCISIFIDEHTSEAGIFTRLEAFSDLLKFTTCVS